MNSRQKSGRTRTRRAKEAYAQNPSNCAYCQKGIPYEKRRSKYCDSSCAAKGNRNRANTGQAPPPCKKCGELTRRHRRWQYNTFCDSCINAGEHIRRIRCSEDCKTDKALRVYLLRTRPHRCNCCGRKTWEGSEIPLEVDHKDGNATNNKEDNVHLICPNCHAQRPTSKGKNRGNGRKARREWRRKQKHSLP